MSGWLEIARHELVVALRTRRVTMIAMVYIVGATAGSLLFALANRHFESLALNMTAGSDASSPQASNDVNVNADSIFLGLTQFFSGLPLDELSPLIIKSVAVPVYFWSTLTFLPFIVALCSFDVIQSGLQSRTLCFSSIRVSRKATLLGKFFAHAALHGVIAGIAALAFLVSTVVLVDTANLNETLPGILLAWFLSLPVALAYLALTFCASTLTHSAIKALMLALGGTALVRFITLFESIPQDSSWSWLRGLRWISPMQVQSNFWRADLVAPTLAIAAFLATAVIMLTLAERRLHVRDL